MGLGILKRRFSEVVGGEWAPTRAIQYSSVSHMGYVLVGASALGTVGLQGASMQMFTPGLITGMLFVLVGMVYDRAHTRDIGELSGLAHRMPFITTMMMVAGLASLGVAGAP